MQQQDVTPTYAEIAKVKVDRNRTIYLDRKAVSIQELRDAFERLKQANGAVWYYRENPRGEPHPTAGAVIQAVIDAKLPVRLMEQGFDA